MSDCTVKACQRNSLIVKKVIWQLHVHAGWGRKKAWDIYTGEPLPYGHIWWRLKRVCECYRGEIVMEVFKKSVVSFWLVLFWGIIEIWIQFDKSASVFATCITRMKNGVVVWTCSLRRFRYMNVYNHACEFILTLINACTLYRYKYSFAIEENVAFVTYERVLYKAKQKSQTLVFPLTNCTG